MKKKPMNAKEYAFKASVRALTRKFYKKNGKCERCGRTGYTEFDHYEYTPYTYQELCAICHRNDTKRQYKKGVMKEWLSKLPK